MSEQIVFVVFIEIIRIFLILYWISWISTIRQIQLESVKYDWRLLKPNMCLPHTADI